MDIVSKIVSNGFILVIPILVWNLIFAARLPPIYRHKLPNTGIVRFLTAGEQIFRYVVFLAPFLMRTEVTTITGKAGLFCYAAGTTLYFLSWLPPLRKPGSIWSTTAAGFLAPAYTPLVWLVGLSLTAESYYFNLRYSPWHYILPSVIFIFFHVMLMAKKYGDQE